MPRWTSEFQRGVLSALIGGKLGLRADSLRPEFFTEEREKLAREMLQHHRESGRWPTRMILSEIARPLGKEVRVETRKVLQVDDQFRDFTITDAKIALKRRAIDELSIRIAELSDDPSEFERISRGLLEDTINTAENVPPPLDYGKGIWDRHEDEAASQGLLVAPMGIPTLDNAKGGGLVAGEVGVIMGPTKRGKSHVAISFGARTLRAGHPVLHVTLEMRDIFVAKRYDRTITGMTSEEIQANPNGYKAAWSREVPDPSKLCIRQYPRYGLSIQGLEDLLKRKLDEWGEPCLLVVDYAALMTPSKQDRRDLEISKIHGDLSAICMRNGPVPCWTPFQSNRAGLMESSGEVGMEHAGGSYEALQHLDLILTLNQDSEDKRKERMHLSMEGSRESAAAWCTVQIDWSRTQMEEIGKNGASSPQTEEAANG